MVEEMVRAKTDRIGERREIVDVRMGTKWEINHDMMKEKKRYSQLRAFPLESYTLPV